MKARFLLVRFFVLLAFSSLGFRLVYVQGVLRSELEERADRQCPVKSSSKEVRHRIEDRNGLTLAETVQVSSCFVDPSLIKDKARTVKKLALALGVNESQLEKRLNKSKGSFLWVKRGVPSPLVEKIKELDLPGVGFKQEKRRHYPLGVLGSHLLGFVGYEGKGLSGIESAFENVLSDQTENEEKPGGNVQLTLDATIQKIAESELEWGVKKTKSKKGMVVIQDPISGEILAMASWPPVSLDPDNPSMPGELRVPCLVDTFEPGSTFKIVTGAAAIEEKLFSGKEVFDGENGAWKIPGITIHDHEPLKRMTFEDIFVHSSNIGTGKIADRLGNAKLYQYARLFGFGVQPGSGLVGEAKGALRTLNKWSGVSKYVVSFGQELSVSPLQLVGAYSALANGGVLMEPKLVKRIVDDKGTSLWTSRSAEVRRVVSVETAKKMTEVLVHVVERGTGINAKIQWDPHTQVAGKTGTAQKWDSVLRRYHPTLTLVSFCGFFPAFNPKYTIVVILDEPAGRSWGGLDAAPIFRRIAEKLGTKAVAMVNQNQGATL
ncbi:MAG: Stage V sporulation protein D [Elusimicrobia bacterium]|nr:Stage V sporulation protein D [Elusimicrobiota bacterium]